MCDRLGVLPVHDHYYEPLVVPGRHLRRPLEEVRSLPGVDLRIDEQLSLLGELSEYSGEAEMITRPATSSVAPTALNEFYGPGDADALYLLVRHLRPRRVLEVGSGHSTKIIAAALAANHAEAGPSASSHVCIEPFESPWLEDLPVEVRRERVEMIDASVVDQLAAGDILFIDASHVIQPQGDVLRVFLDLLPPPGGGRRPRP